MNTNKVDRTAAEETLERLRTQEAIPAREFGAMYGMTPREVSMAIQTGRLGLHSFQRVEKGMHYVRSADVIQHFADRGVDLFA